MKRVSLYGALCFGLVSTYVHSNNNVGVNQPYVFPVVGQIVEITIKNNTKNQYVVLGDFIERVVMLNAGATLELHYPYTVNNGPRVYFIRPNELVLYADDSEYVERELKNTRLNPGNLANVLNAHMRTHGYSLLENRVAGKLAPYYASDGDYITMGADGAISKRNPINEYLNYPTPLYLTTIKK